MGIKKGKFRGKIKIKGTPKQMAKAEIMIMEAEEKFRDRKRRRKFFMIIDLVIIVAFALAIYSIYTGNIIRGLFLALIGILPLVYYILRRILKKKRD